MIRRAIVGRKLVAGVPASAAILVMSITGLLLGFERQTPARERGVMLMNRIGPSSAELYVDKSNGTEERKLATASAFDYHASYSPDGRWTGDGAVDSCAVTSRSAPGSWSGSRPETAPTFLH